MAEQDATPFIEASMPPNPDSLSQMSNLEGLGDDGEGVLILVDNLTPHEAAELDTMSQEDVSLPYRIEERAMRLEDKEYQEALLMGCHDEDAEEYNAFLGNPEELELIAKINSGELNVFDAARQNDVPRLTKILEYRPELADQQDWAECTPLQLACMLRSYDAAEKLLAFGASASRRNPLGRLPLDYIREPAKKAYMQRVADRYDRTNDDFLDDDSTLSGPTNEIRDAAFKGDMLKLDQLLKRDGLQLLTSQDKKGHTPLMFACMGQQIDCAFYLLERGADIYQKTSYDQTADSFILDKVHRTKVQSFAFKVSAKGRAMMSSQFARRRNEEKEAIADKTGDVMEDIFEVVREREQTLIIRARLLTEFATDWAQNYFINEGMKGAERWFMHLYWEWQAELGREAQNREDMAGEEEYMRHYLFVCEQIRIRQAEEAERQRLAEIARREEEERKFREERDKMMAEARAEAAKIRQMNLEKKVEAQALQEWEKLERESRQREWAAHCDTKPHKLKLYQRMRFAISKTSVTTMKGNFLPETHDFREGTWGPRELSYEVEGRVNYSAGEVNMEVLTEEDKAKVVSTFGNDHKAVRAARRTAVGIERMML
jgi:hypothetical protein